MKIFHISDLHWRSLSRHKEYTEAFEILFEKAKKEKPDLFLNLGDVYHTKTQNISPEIIERLAWMFRSLADIAPTYSILGNHDGNLTNLQRKDIITPIHEAINHPRAHLLRKSGTYKVEELKDIDLRLHSFSAFDKKGWDAIKPVDGAINIALFHGSIVNSQMDNGWRLPEELAEENARNFSDFNFTFLGDIHKQQYLGKRKDKNGIDKPYMGYPGSLIQQNFGESEKKGFLIWNIRSNEDWDVEFCEIENKHPFITIPWQGTVAATLDKVEKTRGEKAFLPGARFRVSSSHAIPSIETRRIIHELKEVKKASEVVFKYDLLNKMDNFSTGSVKVSKKSLREDPDGVVSLYLDYIKSHVDNYQFDIEQLNDAEKFIRKYMSKLIVQDPDLLVKNQNWTIKTLEFDNLFRYGEGNKIDFNDMEGIVGIFGNNAIGKSSIIGAITYALYNTSDRGPLKNAHIINTSKRYCKAKIRISVGGTDYIIERQSSRALPKNGKGDPDKTNTTVNFYRIEWDEILEAEKRIILNSVTRDDTDKEIRKLIGTPNDFLLTALSSQGSVDRFIKEGPTERKKILARFLELDIFDSLYNLCKDDYSALNNKGNSFSPEFIINQITKCKKQINEDEVSLAIVVEKINKLREQKDEVKLWLMHHEKSAADVNLSHLEKLEEKIKECGSNIVDKELELETIEKNIEKSSDKLKEIKTNKAKIDLKSLEKQLEDFESLKVSISEMKHELTAQETLLLNQRKNIRKLEVVPCGDQFPECHYIREGHQDKKKIKKQEELVEKLTQHYKTNEKLWEELVSQKIKETILKYHELDRSEFNLTKELENFKNHKPLIKNEIAALKRDEKKYSSELSLLQKRVDVLEGKEYERKQEQLAKISDTIETTESKKHSVLVELGGHKETLKRLMTEEEESKILIGKLRIYDSIMSAFSKTGIPAMVLKSQLPAINQELEKILDGIVNFKVSLVADLASNVMDVYIEDDHSKRIVELASGMEKTIASMALRVALSNLSSLPKPDMLIIDEGWSSLDEEHLQSANMFLNNLREYFKIILIITHIPEIKECANVLIEINNEGADSKISWPAIKIK